MMSRLIPSIHPPSLPHLSCWNSFNTNYSCTKYDYNMKTGKINYIVSCLFEKTYATKKSPTGCFASSWTLLPTPHS
ncbi:hypothetical protein I656_02395 [Geobacillus sp. WSUCF1]|nr:hypothetical protein I656_02395 [Geobacillus sp. WSUCF1]